MVVAVWSILEYEHEIDSWSDFRATEQTSKLPLVVESSDSIKDSSIAMLVYRMLVTDFFLLSCPVEFQSICFVRPRPA